MGSFPNKAAAQILKSLFVDKDVSAAPALYTNNGVGTKGIFAEVASGAVPLYIGLIAGGANTSGNGIPNGTGNLNTILNDGVIVSSGVAAGGWPVVAGARQLKEFTGTSNTTRQPITFAVSGSTGNDGSSIVTITGPTNPISFAGVGGITLEQQPHESIIGFFITTLATQAGNASALPSVVAYGTLSASRNVQLGDNPTFAANSITITLD
jgi:hypothetical protein